VRDLQEHAELDVTIAGLDAVLAALLALPERMLGIALRARYAALRATLPTLPTRRMSSRQVIAPAALWDRIQNVEIPQLYPVFPYHRFGVGLPDLQLAVDTWHYGVDTAAQTLSVEPPAAQSRVVLPAWANGPEPS
jgi:hypothetical protein